MGNRIGFLFRHCCGWPGWWILFCVEGVIPNSQMKHQFPWNPSILEVNYMVSHTWIGRIRIQMVNLNTWPTPALGIHGNFPRSICGSVPGRLQLPSRDWKRRGAMVPWPCLLQFLLQMVVFGIELSTSFPSLEEPIDNMCSMEAGSFCANPMQHFLSNHQELVKF